MSGVRPYYTDGYARYDNIQLVWYRSQDIMKEIIRDRETRYTRRTRLTARSRARWTLSDRLETGVRSRFML